MESKGLILCVDWGQQSVTSVEAQCCDCSQKLAVAADNWPTVHAQGIEPICLTCLLKRSLDKDNKPVFGGNMVGGKKYTDMDEALAAIDKPMQLGTKQEN